MKILVSCGGTGGHFFPGLAIAKHAKENGHDVLISLSGKNCDNFANICAENSLSYAKSCDFGAKKTLLGKFKLAWNIFKDIFVTRKTVKNFAPDAILAMGSFASFGVCLAAKMEEIPLFLHEGNAILGKNNSWFFGTCKKLFISFPLQNNKKSVEKIQLVGFPIREDLIKKSQESYNKSEMKKRIAMSEKPLLFVFGGSQGAASMNTRIANAIVNIQDKYDFQAVHVAGNLDEKNRLNEIYKNAKIEVKVLDFVKNMGDFYQAADLAIVRSGAATLYECSAFVLPVLAIPLPWAADNHQVANAHAVNELAHQTAIRIVEQKDFEMAHLDEFLREILEQKYFNGKAFKHALNSTNAADKIILEISSKKVNKIENLKH